MRHLIAVLLLFANITWLAAQEAALSSPPRWFFSSHAGLATSTFYPSADASSGSGLLLNEIGYRLHRHLDVGVQIGVQRESSSTFSRLEPASNDFISFTTSWNSRKSNVFLGLQAKLNYRVGQGDLSLSASYGIVRHANLVRATSPLPFSARIRMAPLTYSYFNIHFAYTYWATPRYGLMVGFTVFTPQNDNLNRNVEMLDGNITRYTIADSEVEGLEVTDSELSRLRSRIDNTSRQYITVGLTTRIF